MSLMKLSFLLLIVSSAVRHGDTDHVSFNPPESQYAVCNSTGTGSFITAEKLLLKCLMEGYDPLVRPSLVANRSVTVTVDSYTADILDLDEKSNVLTTFLRLYMQPAEPVVRDEEALPLYEAADVQITVTSQSWTDVQLKWKLEDFPDVTDINIAIDRIWTPEIVLHNSVDDAFGYSIGKVASVSNTGQVTWRPHGRMRSHCQLDLTSFPFDSQTCHLWIGPGSYDMSLVNVTLKPIDPFRGYRPFIPMTPEWDVEGYTVHRAEEDYGPKRYSSVVFEIRLTRKSAFIRYTLLGPSVVLAILTISLFLIPVDLGERLSMAAAILVSNVLLIVLSDEYLPTDIVQLPTIAKYVGYNLSLITVAIVISIIVVNLHRRDIRREPVPVWMRTLFLRFLSRLLCMGTVQYAHVSLVGATTLDNDDQHPDGEMRSYLSSSRDADDEIDVDVPSACSPSLSQPLALDQTLTDIRNYLKHLANKSIAVREVAAPSHRDLVISEWQQVARVIDRLCFYLLCFITFVFTVVTY